MTILFVDQYATLGGAQRILLDVIGEFSQEHVCLAGLPGVGEVPLALESIGVRHFPLSVPKLTAGSKSFLDVVHYLSGSIKLSRQIRGLARNADLVYVNGPRCALGAVLSGAPTVIANHLIHTGLERRLLAWCFQRKSVRLTTFCSRFVAAQFKGGVIVENWVSPQVLYAPNSRAKTRLELGLSDSDVAVAVLGRISPNKGQAFLAKALESTLTSQLRLFIMGAADHEGDKIPDVPHMTQLGKVESAASLDGMDILVVPSLWEEAFGLVAVEGMARGLPVVVTPSGCLPDIVGGVGLVVPKEDLRSAVVRLANDRQLRSEMGRAGYARVLDRYNPEFKLKDLVDLISRSV